MRNCHTELSELESGDIVDDEFTIQKVEFTVKRLKCRMAGGVDGLSPEHLKHGGPLLNIWLKQNFNAIIFFEYVPACMLTGICPIYKGKDKDSFSCHSYRGITMTSVIMKTFEYVMLDPILPVLECNGNLFHTQIAYWKLSSCQDAILATQEAFLKVICDGSVAFLCLYDFEKAYDSIEHPFSLVHFMMLV